MKQYFTSKRVVELDVYAEAKYTASRKYLKMKNVFSIKVQLLLKC